MSTFQDFEALQMNANADLSALRFHIVVASSNGGVSQATNATSSMMFGVLQNKPQSGERAVVAVEGKCSAIAGGAITANALVTSTTSGRLVAAASGNWVLGRLLETSVADGDVVAVYLMPFRLSGAA